jgi:hypothetical protein
MPSDNTQWSAGTFQELTSEGKKERDKIYRDRKKAEKAAEEARRRAPPPEMFIPGNPRNPV